MHDIFQLFQLINELLDLMIYNTQHFTFSAKFCRIEFGDCIISNNIWKAKISINQALISSFSCLLSQNIIQKLAYLNNSGNVNYMKYRFSIQVPDINNNFVVEVIIFLQSKLKILRGFAFNLLVMTKLVDHFDIFMLNIMAGLC